MHNSQVFNGNVFIFYAYDVGDDIALEEIKEAQILLKRSSLMPKYFKNYHVPLSVELPHPHTSSRCISAKLHNFGVISLEYKIPVHNISLESLREDINEIDNEFREQSILDASILFKKIKNFIKQPKFFYMRRSYVVIEIDMESTITDIIDFKNRYGNTIASLLKFETESLSEYQKDEILESAIGYYRGDLIIIDSEAAFVYDEEYEELLDLFEFANIQQLELQYFDKVLDSQLNEIYEKGKIKRIPLGSYLPFIGVLKSDPIGDLGKLRVDISVITERLANSIKLAGDPYYSELYSILIRKFDLANWRESIHKKLDIITDIRAVFENKVTALREDFLSILIIVLIFIETMVGILSYLRH